MGMRIGHRVAPGMGISMGPIGWILVGPLIFAFYMMWFMFVGMAIGTKYLCIYSARGVKYLNRRYRDRRLVAE